MFRSSSGSSGYESSASSSDGPPRNVFSQDTLHSILSQAAKSGRLSQSDADAIRRSSSDAIPRSSGRSSHGQGSHYSEKSSRGCDCCRPGYDTPPSSSHGQIGSVRTDANGDRVQEWDGSDAPDLRIHCPPSPPPEQMEYRSKSGGRKHSSGSVSSSGSSRSRDNYKRSHRVDANGDQVEEWDGEGDLGLRIHRDRTPPPMPRRGSSRSSSSGQSSSGKSSKSSKSSKDRKNSSGHQQQLGF